ncbi:MAG: helix-turn-helix transcriptional regulator [Chthonomonadaceae bacterium]|nr:helix-turn-helix transcriptional regulator [Chthonomonadaceae bacterium]
MQSRPLSKRETEIVELSIQGYTNDAIAAKLDLSVGTVNTYWLRIRLKVGGLGRTDTVAKVITERADLALREANVERKELVDHMADRARDLVELRAALALLQLAMDQIKSTVWATDMDLQIHLIANGDMPSTHCGVLWEVGKTVYEIFKTTDSNDLAIHAHSEALKGVESSVRLEGEFKNMTLRAIPLLDESAKVMGCISILNVVGA